jgi:DNA mismatch repair protein MutS2
MGKNSAADMEPCTDFNVVRDLLEETEDGVNMILQKGSPPISWVKDIDPFIKRADAGGVLNFLELLSVANLLRSVRKLKDYSTQFEASENRVVSMISQLVQNRKVEERIFHCIVSEDEMSDDASPELADIRKQIRDKQNSIKDKLNEIIRSSKYSKIVQDPVVTMRGDRYCIPVKVEYRQELKGLVHDTSASGQTLFIEPIAIVDTNNKIRELKSAEQHEIERILYELTASVSDIKTELLADMTLISKLDFTFARAKYALDLKAVKPNINSSGIINIVQGRHPLLEPHTVVPINFYMGKSYNTLVITGPNTGGKTVALKTVGIFTLMVQSGLLIPAKAGTELCVYEHVFADIGDEQSIEQSLSTFSSHMTNIVDIISEANDRSLVLADELGAGTDPTEGAALAMSILECLNQMGCSTVATTHYSEIKVFAATTKGFENACCEFDVATLKPTYRLLIGVPGKSNAFAISSRLGLDGAIIERAKEFLTTEDLRFEDMLMGIEANREKAEQERFEAEQLRAEIERLKNDIKNQRDTIDEQKDKLLLKSREEARAILGKAKAEADRLLTDMRKSDTVKGAENSRNELNILKSQIEADLNINSLTEDEGEAPKSLKPGDTVRIATLGGKGTVLKEPDKDGNVFIQAGIMKINAKLSDLRLETDVTVNRETDSSKRHIGKASDISAEVDVRGLTVEEAKDVIDKYIDDAFLAHLSQFTIIHGKGTGALRTGIQAFLKSHRKVKSFRTGTYGEGDAGVTVVEIS